MGKGFYKENDEYKETNKLAILMTGEYYLDINNSKVDFYVLKGVLEELLDYLGYNNRYRLVVNDIPKEFHPGQSAVIELQGKQIGVMGKLHPNTIKGDVYALEIDLDKLFVNRGTKMTFKDIPKYPSIIKDCAFVVDKKVPAGDLIAQIKSALEGKAGLQEVSQATPSISVDANGLITATSTQADGHVTGGVRTATKQLTVQEAKTITPSTENQTAVASGVYTTGAVTVAGDTNLVAENIAEGVSIFGVTGTHSGGSGGTGVETCTVRVLDSVAYGLSYTTVDESGEVYSNTNASYQDECICVCNTLFVFNIVGATNLESISCTGGEVVVQKGNSGIGFTVVVHLTAGAGEIVEISISVSYDT